MTPSAKRAAGLEPLPPALSSMWRLCRLGYRYEPRLMVISFVLSQLAALPDALLALWLWLLGKGVLQHRTAWIEIAAVGLGVSTAATWFLRTLSARVQRRFRDRVTIALEAHVARLQASVVTVAHQERRNISIACPCCATRCSSSTTCTCRCSRPWDGSCAWA